MKNNYKKFAALIAAIATASTMGTLTSFAAEQAITSDHYVDGGTSREAEVDLKARVTETIEGTSTELGVDPEKNDSDKHIWNVTIDAAELKWDLVRYEDTTTDKYSLTWDAETHTYIKGGGAVTKSYRYAVAENDTAVKTINIKNDSNFSVTREVVSLSELFNVTYPNGFDKTFAIEIGGNVSTDIEILPDTIQDFTSEEYTSIGTAKIYLNAFANASEDSFLLGDVDLDGDRDDDDIDLIYDTYYNDLVNGTDILNSEIKRKAADINGDNQITWDDHVYLRSYLNNIKYGLLPSDLTLEEFMANYDYYMEMAYAAEMEDTEPNYDVIVTPEIAF